MASSRYLISSQTLGSAAASVTFSSIPATYTDLVLRMSIRLATGNYCSLRFNSASSNTYSRIGIAASGASVGNISNNNINYLRIIDVDNSTNTSNTFSSQEIYLPNYVVSQNHPISIFGATEDNSTAGNTLGIIASLWSNTSAISSIEIADHIASSATIATGSSFYLYGLKNS